MDNNFMHTLARNLLFYVSYREMKDILNEHSLSENPKQILISLRESKNRMYITCAIFIIYTMMNVYLFIFISEHDYFSSSFRFLLLFLMSLLFSSLTFIFFSRQVILMSKFYRFNKYEKSLNYIANILIFLQVIFYSIHFRFEVDVMFLDIFTTVSIMVLIIFINLFSYCFISKSFFYYFPMCNSFASLCFIFQIGVARSILGIENYSKNIGIALVCYLIEIALVCMFYFILQKKQKHLL